MINNWEAMSLSDIIYCEQYIPLHADFPVMFSQGRSIKCRMMTAMNKALYIISILILTYQAAGAQNLSITSFAVAENDLTAMNSTTRRVDQNGNRCALLKIETTETGLSFDTGMIGIVDIEYHPGEIWIYVPKGTRKITVSHRRHGVLRDWQFPYPVESARTYILRLEGKAPEPEVVHDTVYKTVYVEKYIEKVIEKKVRVPRPRPDFSSLPSHYVYATLGLSISDWDTTDLAVGIGYAFVPGRLGGYVSYLDDFDCSMFTAGMVFRLTNPESKSEVQAYVGAGLYGGYCMSGDIGLRIGFRGSREKKFSFCDFSFGCSYADRSFYPYVSLSVGIPVLPVLNLAK